MFKATQEKLDEIGRRIGGQSRGMVVELLVALYGDQIGPDTPIPARLLMSDTRRTNKAAGNSQAKPKGRKK